VNEDPEDLEIYEHWPDAAPPDAWQREWTWQDHAAMFAAATLLGVFACGMLLKAAGRDDAPAQALAWGSLSGLLLYACLAVAHRLGRGRDGKAGADPLPPAPGTEGMVPPGQPMPSASGTSN